MHDRRREPDFLDAARIEAALRAIRRARPPDPARLRLACLLVYGGLMLTLSAVFGTAQALPDAPGSSNFTVQHWTVDQGLRQNTVRALARDARGRVWVGSVDGLSRFDGARFRNFRIIDYPELGSNRITAVVTSADGTVWIGTENRGLVRYRDGRFRALPICDQRCRVSGLAVAPGGTLWMLSSFGLYRIDPAAPAAPIRTETGAGDARWLVALDDGRVAYSLGEGLAVHAPGGGRLATLATPDGLGLRGVAAVGDRLIAATANRIYEIGDDGLRPMPGPVGAVRTGSDRIRALRAAGAAVVVQLGTGALHRLRDDGFTPPLPMAAGSLVLSVLDGPGDAAWIGTRMDGLYRVSPSRMFRAGGYRDRAAGSVLPIIDHPETGVLVGRVCGGLEHIDDEGRAREMRLTGPQLERCIWTLLRDTDDSILIGSAGGDVQRLSGTRIENLRLSLDDRRTGANFLFRDARDRIWLGADNGLFRIRRDRITRAAGSSDDVQLLSALDHRDGGLLLGTGSGMAVYDANGFRRLNTGTWLDTLAVRALFREDEETVWLGTYGGGLWRYRAGRWIQVTPAQGLVEDVVSCMLLDARGRLWMSGNHGISQVRLAELNALVDGRRDRVHAWALTEDDGMPDAETNGGGQPACHADRRGRFWFPTVAGAVSFDPLSIGELEPGGHVHIESAALEGRRIALAPTPLALPGDARQLEIRYSVAQFENPHRLRFRYRLAGLDDRWLEAGTSRVARFPVVPEGAYRFEVQPGFDDGRWFDRTAVLPIRVPRDRIAVRPGWLWTAAAVVAALGLMVYWRIGELRRRDARLNEVIEERTRELREMNVRLNEMSRTDELTGIANHRRLRHYLRDQWRACAADDVPIVAIMIDVDHFKRFNDTHGHQAGDRFLRAMAQSLAAGVRGAGGLLARYGGEEFIAVLPGRTLEEGLAVADSLRQAVISLEFGRPDGERGFMTASFGVAVARPSETGDPETLIQRADRAMYRAKRAGGNGVRNGERD
jgi:diguanylate cyclase (GGDEF)-like protein